MEKMVMSFIEMFKKASEELEKAKGDKCHMLTFAIDEESGKICAVINGYARNLSALLAYAALRDKAFKEIFRNAAKAVEMQEQKNNK